MCFWEDASPRLLKINVLNNLSKSGAQIFMQHFRINVRTPLLNRKDSNLGAAFLWPWLFTFFA